MALYDALQKRNKKSLTPLLAEAGRADVGTQTAAIQAASGGKAASPGAAPAVASLAEQSAASGAVQDVQNAAAQTSLQAQAIGLAEQQEASQTSLATKQLDEQMRAGQQQLAAQATDQRASLASQEGLAMDKLRSNEERKSETITMQAEQAIANLLSNRKISENDIFSSFAQDERELEFRRDQAAIEQMATMMALRDRAYVDELNRVGAQRNLDDQQEFEKETARVILGEQMTNYLSKLDWTQADLTDNLKFAEKMAQMDINQAWAMLKMASDSASAAQMASGITGLGSAAAQHAYGTPDKPVTITGTSTTAGQGSFDPSSIA